MATDAKPGWNWLLWAGFALSVTAFLSYFALFVNFPSTRNFPWASLILFAIAAGLLMAGIRRAFHRAGSYRGKIFGPILACVSALILGFFVLLIFVYARHLPASAAAPRVGAKAPDFTLTDSDNKTVPLANLLTEQVGGAAPKGVLLVFYRGYW
jgi:hypothetical protein